jgi:hypothetical protein
LTEEWKKKISLAMKGKKKSLETRQRMSLAQTGNQLGRVAWNKGKKGLQKMSPETRIKMSLAHKGEKSHLWQGGITKKNTEIRNTAG